MESVVYQQQQQKATTLRFPSNTGSFISRNTRNADTFIHQNWNLRVPIVMLFLLLPVSTPLYLNLACGIQPKATRRDKDNTIVAQERDRQTERQTDRQIDRQRQRDRDWRRLLTGRYEVPAPLLSPAVNVKLMESAEWRRTWQFGWPDAANFCLFVFLACFLLWAQWIQLLWLDFIVTGYLCITIAHNMFNIIRYGNVNYIHYSFQYLQVA